MLKCSCGGEFKVDPNDTESLVCTGCGLYTDACIEYVGVCGCGHAEEIRKLVHHVLRMAEKERIAEWIGESIEREFIVQTLNARDILEHGSSVTYSWLTDLGKQLLKYFDEHSADAAGEETKA